MSSELPQRTGLSRKRANSNALSSELVNQIGRGIRRDLPLRDRYVVHRPSSRLGEDFFPGSCREQLGICGQLNELRAACLAAPGDDSTSHTKGLKSRG